MNNRNRSKYTHGSFYFTAVNMTVTYRVRNAPKIIKLGWQEGQQLKELAPTPDLIDDLSSMLTTFMAEENWLPKAVF